MKQAALAVLLLLVGAVVSNDLLEATTEVPAGPWLLKIDPENLENVIEHNPHTVNLSLTYTGLDPPASYQTEEAVFVIRVTYNNHLAVSLNESFIKFTWDDIASGNNQTLIVTGNVIGYTDFTFELDILPADGAEASETVLLLTGYHVTIIQASNLWDNLFTIVMAALAIINTINMGCGLDLGIVKQNFLRPVGPIVGFISQFTFMPLFSMGMALLLIEDNLQGFGLLVIGVCPGGLASNFWTLLLDGDVNLSITMTFVSSIAAMGMMPLWLWLLSGFFLPPGSSVQVPYLDMTISLICLTVPLAIGLLIRRFKRNWADFISTKVIKPFSFIIIFIMFGLGFYSLSHIFILFTWQLAVAGLCVSVAGFIFGATFAWITRLNRAQIIAVSLETAMQNGNIAFVLLKMSLPKPYSDIAALTPISQIIMTMTILFIMYGIRAVVLCCKRKSKQGQEKKSTREMEEQAQSLMMKPYADGSNNNRQDGVSVPN